MSEEAGTLRNDEAHPAAFDALSWIRSMPYTNLIMWQSSFASCALSGNRMAEICSETLRRLFDGEPVSDRYLLGLAWSMRYGQGLEAGTATATGSKSKRQSKTKDAGVTNPRKVRNTKARREAGGNP